MVIIYGRIYDRTETNWATYGGWMRYVPYFLQNYPFSNCIICGSLGKFAARIKAVKKGPFSPSLSSIWRLYIILFFGGKEKNTV
jgi:hypothetical protein